jgi:hypothetical protein
MINKLSFMNIVTDVQGILRICFKNLRICNIGIIDGKDL